MRATSFWVVTTSSALRSIVERREQVRELIRKAEEGRTKVKKDIYEKVISDYKGRLEAITAEVNPVSEQIAKKSEQE